VASVLRVSSRDARFQQWEALLSNRGKRQRAGEFLVQGVRPISLAARFGWRFRALIFDAGRPLSRWAEDLLRDVDTVRVAMAPGLLAELGEKDEGAPELVAVVEMRDDDLGRIEAGAGFLGVVLDRPASPGSASSLGGQPEGVTSCHSPPLMLRLLPLAWPGAVSLT
jgi:23S rRNA (uridine2479-2'-O)-methyltransferase